MATFTQIKEIRLRIADPALVIDIKEVDVLPVPYNSQVAYLLSTDNKYYKNGVVTKLRVSDVYLSFSIDSYGVDKATCMAISLIIAQLGNQFILVKNDSGSDKTEYNDILSMLSYYKQLRKDCDEKIKVDTNNSTGRFVTTAQPEIAGGEL